jgi:hypothetical protein
MKHCLATVLLTVITSFWISISAQKISGKVLRETGTGAGHVSVAFKDRSDKIFTNPDGTFTIMAKKLPDTLVFSSPGFEPYSVIVTEKTVKDVNFEIVLLSKREKTSSGRDAAKLMTMPATTVFKDGYDGLAASSDSIGRRDYFAAADMERTSTFLGTRYSNKKTIMLDSLPLADVYKSHLLTAGEINDFNKWKMWEDFQENEFKVWSEHWDLYPKQRFSVQLQNKEHIALVGQKVFLVNKKTNDTVWSAITDNTGKAELWAELDGKKKEGDYVIACKGSQDIVAASFANGVNRIELNDPCSLSNTVDIAFVVDATGSMGDEIEFLKVELEDVIRNTFSKYADLDLNVGSVFYRDRGDEYITRHVDFQTDLLKVLNFIKLQRAAGGGDTPESVNAALKSALDSLNWHEYARSRILFLILDAPPHDEAKNEMFDLIKRAAAMGIRVVPVVCSGAEKSTEFMMRSIALATNGDYVFLTDDSRVGLPHIKPTTDAFNVELFTNLLQRIITQMVFANKCSGQTTTEIFKTTPPNIEKIRIYPNPTQGNVKIESSTYLKEIFITDFTGKILMRIITNDKERKWNINISAYPNAAYLVKYITTDDRWGAEKIVLIH